MYSLRLPPSAACLQGRITHLVSSMGTTGTIMGTSAYLKAMVRLLLSSTSGADLDQLTNGGVTPLHLATNNGHGAVVEQLLAAGATTAKVNRDGMTALDYARRGGHAAIVAMLT